MSNIDKFVEYLAKNKRSDETIIAYKRDVLQFLNFLKKDIHFVNNEDIDLYKNHMINTLLLNIKSVNRKLVAINQFLTYCQISVSIKQEKVQSMNFLDDILSDYDISKMMLAMDSKNDLRAKALLMTMRLTGMRVSEMLQITIDDIYKSTIRICGKGKKYREIFISDKLRESWIEYSKVRINKGNMFFTGERGAMSRSGVHKILKKYGKMSNIELKKVHCHNFRHKFCKDLIDKDISIDAVADIVGHVNINTTRIYTRKTKKELLDIINDL